MRTSSRLAADREAVIAYLLAAVPGLDRDGAAGVLERAGGPAAVCSVCSRTRPCSYATGKPVCPSGVPRPVQACCRCAKQRPVKASWPIGPVCAPCYGYIRSHPASCHACGTAQPLIARASSGELICGPCAGLAVDYGCRRCGAAGFLLSYGRCAGCVLDDRLTELTDRARNRPGSEQISVPARPRTSSPGTPPARPVRGRPWKSRRCAPTVLAPGRRPPYVRGHRDTGGKAAPRA